MSHQNLTIFICHRDFAGESSRELATIVFNAGNTGDCGMCNP